MHFQQRLIELRTAAGLTQSGLADASGVPLATIRQYEQGKRSPQLETAILLADALKVTLDHLAGRETPSNAPPTPPAPPPTPRANRLQAKARKLASELAEALDELGSELPQAEPVRKARAKK